MDNESIPVGTSIDHWIADSSFNGEVWAFVEIDLSLISGTTKRVNITIPERVLSLIDLYRGLSANRIYF
jgi:hypothetical protein